MNKFLSKIAEANLYPMLEQLEYDLLKFQKIRLLKAILGLFVGAFVGSLSSIWAALIGGLFLALFVWWKEYHNAVKTFKQFTYLREIEFNKFTRMLIPLLLENGATLYGALNKMLKRLEPGHVKDALQKFLIELNENPESEEPFIKFANAASGSEEAILFLSSLYDYKESSFDTSVIEELGKTSSEKLFEGVQDIIEFKARKFSLFPTKLTMVTFIPVLGYAIAMIIDATSKLQL